MKKSVYDIISDPDSLPNKKRYFGIYRGFCEYSLDPLELGRVKVRVPQVHGLLEDVTGSQGITTDALPWASPCSMGGGMYDSGAYIVPLIGATLWVMFEQGDPESPVVMGGWPSVAEDSPEMNTIQSRNIPGVETSMGTWNAPKGLDTPLETHDREKYEPSRRVAFKTPKGATIIAEDKDGSEYLRIIDRVGQVFEMYCPVTAEENKGNASQRGTSLVTPDIPTADSLSGVSGIDTQLSVSEKCVDEQAWIKLKDAKGQYIKLWAKEGDEKLILKGKSGHLVILDSKDGEEKIRIEDMAGNYFQLDAANNDMYIFVQNNKTESVNQDKIDIIGNDLSVSVKNKKTEIIEGNSELAITKDQITTVEGDRKTSVTGTHNRIVDGDENETVAGNRSTSISGGSVTSMAGGGIATVSDYKMTIGGNLTLTVAAGTITSIIAPIINIAGNPAGGGIVTLGGPSTVVVPTGQGAFCGLPMCLFTGAPHSGIIATGV